MKEIDTVCAADQTFSVDGRKTMLVNMDHVAYVEVIESCE